ncbi:acyl carrier protein [Streptomyces hundungensis]|uniref:acyl carrier protein n=1 Tax=Streptomyces hundungensis TaxID=1077946 RepID=UPI0033E4A7D3
MSKTLTVPLSDQILDLLVSEFDAPVGTTVDTEFKLLGFDSLILVELAVALSSLLGAEVTDDELQEAGTVTKTVAHLAARGIHG